MTVESQWESDWPIGRLKNVLAVPITDGPHSTPEFIAEGVPFLSVDAIQDGELVFSGCRYVSFDDHTEFVRKARPRRNDLLMGKAASTGKIARVKTTAEFSIWSPLALIRINETLADPGFIEYCLKSPECQFEIDGYSNANTQKNIGMGDIPRISLPLPALAIQVTVARFLDRETAQIDELIGKQERLIELLRERRAASINLPFDNCSNRTQLRRAVVLSQTGPFGTQLSADEYVVDGVPVINPTHIQDGRIAPDPSISVSADKARELARHRFDTGDIVLGRKGEVDKAALVAETDAGFICGSDSMLLRPSSETDPAYLWWFLQSPSAHNQLERWSVGSTVAGLNQTTISKVLLPLPSLQEQQRIVDKLSAQVLKIDELSEKTRQSIELLRERRSALVSAAVTGRLDVREGDSKP